MGLLTGRVPRRALAWLATAAMLFASAGPIVSGHEAVDSECAALVIEHDHAAHRVGKAPAEGAAHCAACHLTRTVRAGVPTHAFRLADILPDPTAEPSRLAPHRVDLRTDFTRGPPR